MHRVLAVSLVVCWATTGCGNPTGAVTNLAGVSPRTSAHAVPVTTPAAQRSAVPARHAPSQGWRAILDDLNRNVAYTERGERLILTALTDAIRGQIENMLRTPPRP